MSQKKKSYHNLTLCVLYLTFSVYLISNVCSLNIQDTKISTSRNSIRTNICNYYTTSYSVEQRQKNQANVQKYSYMSEADIQSLIQSRKYTFSSLTVLITIPHIIAVTVLLFLIIPLCCCCLRPDQYLNCLKKARPDQEMYSRCELKWTAYFALVLYIVVLVGGLLGLIDGSVIVKKYNDVGCKNAAIFDDLLSGRISGSVDGRFFVGLEPLRIQLATFNNTKLSTFYSDSSNSLSTADQVQTKQSLVQTTIDTTYNSYVNSVYLNAFSADGVTYYDVDSAFKTMHFGPASDSTKMLGIIKSNLQTIFNQINSVLDNMITAWQVLQTTTQATLRSQITSFTSSTIDFKSKLELYLNDVKYRFYNNQLYDQLSALITVYYGIIFGFSLLGLIASILITFCTVVRTRLVMYFTCGFLVFFGIVGFGLLIYLTYMFPQMNQVCAYADNKLSSGTQTKGMLQKMGYPDFADKISSCMTDGSGKMLDKINSQFSTSLDKINIIAQGTLTFNNKISSFTQSNIDDPFTTVYSALTKVRNAQVWDINDATAINHVSNVFSKNYVMGGTCNTVAIDGDVWMPSFSLFTCPAGKAKMPVCSDLSVQATCPLGCYQILNQFQSPSGDHSYVANLATRYGASRGGFCSYYQYIVNLHDNWNIVRQNNMDTVNSSINSLKVLVDDYATKVNSVKAALNSFKTTLQANLNSMTNLTSGSFNGIDCRTIGQSIWEFRDAYCIGLIQSFRYNIICLCLICYGTLLLACFVTCTGVRHFKHLQKLQIHAGYKGTPISLSETIIIDIKEK